jgi:hypothetical protein
VWPDCWVRVLLLRPRPHHRLLLLLLLLRYCGGRGCISGATEPGCIIGGPGGCIISGCCCCRCVTAAGTAASVVGLAASSVAAARSVAAAAAATAALLRRRRLQHQWARWLHHPLRVRPLVQMGPDGSRPVWTGSRLVLGLGSATNRLGWAGTEL